MKTKKCLSCHALKTLDQFHKHKSMGDGTINHCKPCISIRNRSYLKKKKKDKQWLKKERERCRIKQAKYRANGTAHQSRQEIKNKWGRKNRLKTRAECRAQRAQGKGLIKKPSACAECGTVTTRLEKHHNDYSKPLEVTWLCAPCHGKTRRLP